MRGSVLISFFGISMAMAGSIVACGGDEEKAATTPTGAEGESCTRRADCSGGLKCFDNVCVKTASPSTGGSGGTGNEGGGPSTGGTGGATGGSGGKGGSTTGGSGGKGGAGGTGPSPDLGGEGESCARSADCLAGLGCFNNRCTMEPTGDAGDGNVPGPALGGEGETCVLSADCSVGLICVPQDTGGMGSSVGICVPVDTGIRPTGNSCAAECLTSADCCELPTELHATLAAKSCTEINKILSDAAEDCTAPTAMLSPLCLAKDAYCSCASGNTTWRCDAGQCTYNAACSVDGLVLNGCATFSRSGRALQSTCDATGTQRCRATTGPAFCDSDADCENKAVSDDNTDTCVADECVCFNSSACLRKCSENIDCAWGKTCQSEVCVPSGMCTSDEFCQDYLNDYRATCDEGTCTKPCTRDLDCNDALSGGTFDSVCEDGTCQPIGCASHDECANPTDIANMVASPRKMFCTPVATTAPGETASSAITD